MFFYLLAYFPSVLALIIADHWLKQEAIFLLKY